MHIQLLYDLSAVGKLHFNCRIVEFNCNHEVQPELYLALRMLAMRINVGTDEPTLNGVVEERSHDSQKGKHCRSPENLREKDGILIGDRMRGGVV